MSDLNSCLSLLIGMRAGMENRAAYADNMTPISESVTAVDIYGDKYRLIDEVCAEIIVEKTDSL